MAKLGIWRLMAERHNHALLREKHDDDSAEMLIQTQKKDLYPPRSDLLSLAGSLSQLNEPVLMGKVKTKKASDKMVSFSDVQVRTYEVILGDNPDCSFPLSLGWKYSTAHKADVNTYEDEQQPKRTPKPRLQVASIEPDLNTMHIGQVLDPLFLTTKTRTQDNAVDYASSTIAPLTLHERRLRLRAQGHSEQSLRQQERKRRVQLALEWSSGQFPKEAGGFPYNTCAYFRHYIL
jgi:hypothetical protein